MATKIKDLRKSLLVDENMLKERQRIFQKQLDKFKANKVGNPVDIFIKLFKIEKLKIAAKNNDEKILYTFLLLSEMQNMVKDNEHSEAYIKNIVNIFKKKEVKNFIIKINFKHRFIKKIEEENSFNLPNNFLFMQKKGKIGRKHILRNSYITTTAFGQIKNLNKKKLYKPQYFKDQWVYLDMKNKILSLTEKQKKKLQKGIKEKKVLKWIDNNKTKDLMYRLRFQEINSGRERTIYFEDPTDAQRMKDNAIFQRMIITDPNKKQKFNIFQSIWKVKMAEYFYTHYLNNLIQKDCTKQMQDATNKVKFLTQAFLKKYYPNLYDSGYDPLNTFNFEDNSHLKIKDSNKRRVTDQDTDKKNFATVVNNETYISDLTEIEKMKQKIHQERPFEKLNQKIEINQGLIQDFISAFKFKQKLTNFQDKNLNNFITNIARNSKLILNVNKLVIDNVFSLDDCHLDQDEINNLLFKVETSINQGNHWAQSLTFVEESTPEFIAFDIDSSFKVDIKNLKNIKIKIINTINKDVLFDQIVDISDKIDNVFLENIIQQKFDFDYKGLKMNGAISFVLIFFPRNLEIAHFTLNKDLIESNFEKFSELLSEIETYVDYHKLFFSKSYLKLMLGNYTTDFFYFLNRSLPRIKASVLHQENLFINSYKSENYKEFSDLFSQINKSNFTSKEIFIDLIDRFQNGSKKGVSIIYDLILRAVNLISPKERLLLNGLIYNFKTKNFLNLNYKENAFGYQTPQISYISEQTKKYLKKINYLNSDQEFLIWNLIFKTYLILENNFFLNKQYQISFSQHYIPIIVKFVQLNSSDMQDKDLLFILTNQIVFNNHMPGYSFQGSLEHLNSCLIYFKMIFKRIYPVDFTFYMNFMMSFDNYFYECLLSSFAKQLDAINFNIYIDFKNILFLILTAQDKNLNYFSKFEKLDLSFSYFIDILFLIECLVNGKEIMNNVEPHKFFNRIDETINLAEQNYENIFSKIFKQLDFLYTHNFFEKDFHFINRIIKTRNKAKFDSFTNLSFNFKTLQIKKQKIMTMLYKEIVQNDLFVNRAHTLYKNSEKKFSTIPNQTQKLSDSEQNDNDQMHSFIDEDIFFEIIEDFEEDFEDLEVLKKKKVPKVESLILFLNNLNSKQIELQSKSLITVSDLNNIMEFNDQDFQNFVQISFSCSEVTKLELYNDLSVLFNQKKIPLIRFFIALIIFYTENISEITETFNYLAKLLTQIFFQSKDLIFDQIVNFIMNEVYQMLPLIYYKDFEKNVIDNLKETQYSYVKQANLILDEKQIDITWIVIKHYCESVYISQLPSINFNRAFCSDIETLFSELIQKGDLEPNFDQFEIFIDLSQQRKQKSVTIPFKITFAPDTKVFSKIQKPIFFYPEYNDQNLIEQSELEKLYKNSPMCFFNQFTILKSPLSFMQQKFIFSFYFNKDIFLTVTVNFSNIEGRTCSNLLNWNYVTQQSKQLIKFTKNKFDIDLPYCYFFLPLGEFIQVLSIFITQNLNKEDILKFKIIFMILKIMKTP